jgi:hypothetical protein
MFPFVLSRNMGVLLPIELTEDRADVLEFCFSTISDDVN